MTNPPTADTFRYLDFEVDGIDRAVRCHYQLGSWRFTETITVEAEGDWDAPAVHEAARLVFLLAAVSYYKAGAPPTIDLGDTPIRPGELAFLEAFYRDGLGEYAFRNDLVVDPAFVGGVEITEPVAYDPTPGAPLLPFGGGIDSIVTLESVRPAAVDPALFVLSRAGDRFAAIEDAAAVTGLPIVRAGRELDPEILRSAANGFRNGHVPITGILSSIAVLCAVLTGRDAVVMSNEWSASAGNATVDGRVVNHQYSKSLAFEGLLRQVLANAYTRPPEYFSFLRPYSELWVAQRFADLPSYHSVFRSCNRAFHLDPAARWDTWCGTCDKCCFVDLILSPFVPAADLRAVFGGNEPLDNPLLVDQMRTLCGLTGDLKPWECVGDVDECRTAAAVAARRADRADSAGLAALAAEVAQRAPGAADDLPRLLAPLGPTFTPAPYGA